MKKLIFGLFLFATVTATAQTTNTVADNVNAKKSLTLNKRKVNELINDTIATVDSTALATWFAIKKLVTARVGSGGGSGTTVVSDSAWMKTGNAGTNPATHFIGTTDSVDLVIKVNGDENTRITPLGGVNIIDAAGKRQLIFDPVNKYWAIGDYAGDFGNAVSINMSDSDGTIRLDADLMVQGGRQFNNANQNYPLYHDQNTQYYVHGSVTDSLWRTGDSIFFRQRGFSPGVGAYAIGGTPFGIYAPTGGGGSGTVNSGTQYRIGYYATTGTAISEAAAITANRALISDANGVPTHSAVTATQLGYVDATSSIQTQIDGKANTALSNLASVAINTSLLLGTSDAAALGSTTKQWSDLFLAEGGVINWDNGDATITQVGNNVTLDGAAFTVTSPEQTPASFTSSFAGNMQVNWNSSTSNNVNFVFQKGGTTQWYIGNNASINKFHILNASAGEAVSVLQGLQVGINKTAPTARLHVGASATTANYGSIKIDEGSRQTVAEDGTINYVANNLEFTEGSTVHILAKTLTATATLDFASTAPSTSTDLTITVTGAADGDAVSIGVPNGSVNANSNFTAWVSATNTVTIRFNNYQTVGSIDPASGTFRASVIKY